MDEFAATLAAEPATRRRRWPLLVLLHTLLWFGLGAVLFAVGRAGPDAALPAAGIGAVLLHAGTWMRDYWYLALVGLALWTGIDGVVMLLLSRDRRGRGYLFWNYGQLGLVLGAIALTLVAYVSVFGNVLKRLSG